MKDFVLKIKKMSKWRKILSGLLLFLIKRQKIILGLLLFLIIGNLTGVFQIHHAQAAAPVAAPVALYLAVAAILGGLAYFPTWLESQAIKTAASITYAIAFVGGQIIQLQSKLLEWIVDMSSFTKLPVVQIGWKIVRDFTNLFFIAILIYIAFATILRLGTYTAKKTLWKVVVIAILINFSLMLSGIIIDFSQTIFKYFIFAHFDAQDKTSRNFGEALAGAMRLQTFWSSDKKNIVKTEEIEKENIFTAFVKLAFILIFTFILVIVFGALVFILLIRNFWLWFLLILAPIAWFCWIVPISTFSQYWKQWWQKFLQWAFMAPVIGFFIFLAFTIFFGHQQKQEKTIDTLIKKQELQARWEEEKKAKYPPIFSFNKPETSIFNPINVMQLGLVIGFLIAGLIAGQSLGSKAAAGALGLVNRAGKNTKAWMRRKATKGATKVAGAGLTGLAKGVGKIPLVGSALSKPFGVAGRHFQVKAKAIKGAEEAKAAERIKGKSLGDLSREWKTLSENERLAAIRKALEEGKMPENMKEEARRLAEKGKISKTELLKIDPTLYPDWEKSMKRINVLKKQYDDLRVKDDSDPVFKKAAGGKTEVLHNIQQQIKFEEEKLQKSVVEYCKDKSTTDVSNIITSIPFDKVPVLAETFCKAIAEDPVKYNPKVVMKILREKPVSEKRTFLKFLIRAKMERAPGKNDFDKLAHIENTDPELIKALNKSPGLRQIDATWDNLSDEILKKIIEEEKEKEKPPPPPPTPPPSPPPPTPPPTPPPPPSPPPRKPPE